MIRTCSTAELTANKELQDRYLGVWRRGEEAVFRSSPRKLPCAWPGPSLSRYGLENSCRTASQTLNSAAVSNFVVASTVCSSRAISSFDSPSTKQVNTSR